MLRIAALLLTIGLMVAAPFRAGAQGLQHGLKVPPGFEVKEFVGAQLASDIYCMTLDPKGRVVVAGRGYIKILVDDDGDGKADRAILFADNPRDGAMGLFWEGNHLYVTGDGGLQRFTTTDGDHADGPPAMIRKMRTGSEHGAHAILRGPDGWLYVLCGNNTGIDKSFAQLPTSPVNKPVAGCVLRFSPDLKKSEIVADGFRNPYGFDFNSDGELFTWDSDNERCVSLPWYEGTRFYHVIPGGNYGWLNPQIMTAWRRPPYFLDVVAPVIDLGRGSPTGVTCYRHVQFPEHYRGGFFCSDWTFGKVWFLELERNGASYKAKKEMFLEATGDNGFAPTASVVHPKTGDLYISIGGRGTRGAVYRIRYPEGTKSVTAKAVAKLQPKTRDLNMQAQDKARWLERTYAPSEQLRLVALNMILWNQEKFTPQEHLLAIKANWDSPDRYLRAAAARLLRTFDVQERRKLLKALQPCPWSYLTVLQSLVEDDPQAVLHPISLLPGFDLKIPEEEAKALVTVRLVQLALGGLGNPRDRGTVWEGYSCRLGDSALLARVGAEALEATLDWLWTRTANYPGTWHDDYFRELTRTLAMLGTRGKDSAARKLFAGELFSGPWPPTHKQPADDIHRLIVMARLGDLPALAPTEDVARTLFGIDANLDWIGAKRDTNWPLRMGELCAELVRLDPDLPKVMVANHWFGQPGHVVFARVPGFDRKIAAAAFLKKAKANANYRWNAEIVEFLAELPDEQIQPLARSLWGKAGLDAAFLPILARQPHAEDIPKFLGGVHSTNLATVRLSLDALARLPGQHDHATTAALIRALGTLPGAKDAAPLRDAVAAQLEKATGKKFGTDREAWLRWFATVDAKRAAALANPDGVDTALWAKRLAAIDWSKGDAARGQAVFLKANCAACHSGAAAIGPDLTGIAGRFSRDDLFTAILQPSRDVADRYQTTIVETTGGKLYQGIVVYEAVDGLLLVTGPAQNVRIAGADIAARSVSRLSLMPAGLLDNLLDQEIGDLYSYLKSLTPRK